MREGSEEGRDDDGEWRKEREVRLERIWEEAVGVRSEEEVLSKLLPPVQFKSLRGLGRI